MNRVEKRNMRRLLGLCTQYFTCFRRVTRGYARCDFHRARNAKDRNRRYASLVEQGRCPACGTPLPPDYPNRICRRCINKVSALTAEDARR